MQIERITSRGQLVCLQFIQDNVAASQTDVQVPMVETSATTSTIDVNEVEMPFDGEVAAVSWRLSAAGSAGSLTIGATKGGTENATTTQTVTTATQGRKVLPRGTMPFAAGDNIGAEITTDASWNGTTADLVVWVWALVNLDGI